MHRSILILPEWLVPGRDDSALRQSLPTLAAMAEMGVLSRLAPVPKVESPEALWLGLSPGQAQMRQGPLTVSALGADPPERSTHFHLSLLSHTDGVATHPHLEVPELELRALFSEIWKLNSRSLTIGQGENLDHGLVWEGLGDLGDTSASEVDGKPIRAHLPEGDAESLLRRLIDDSLNLLSEHPVNQQREEEGLPPLNLLWPWGHGVRVPVPNLILRRGEPAEVFSSSLRMAGLTRLTGYRHADRRDFGRKLGLRLEWLAERVLAAPLSIALVESFEDLPVPAKLEERHWLTRELDARLLAPLFAEALRRTARITVLAPSIDGGLGLEFETGRSGAGRFPFDERAMDEKELPTVDVWERVEEALRPLPVSAPTPAQENRP
jgi:hypothetical protein